MRTRLASRRPRHTSGRTGDRPPGETDACACRNSLHPCRRGDGDGLERDHVPFRAARASGDRVDDVDSAVAVLVDELERAPCWREGNCTGANEPWPSLR